MRPFRKFLEKSNGADSYVKVHGDESWMDLKIADCMRSVNISFYFDNNKTKEVALKKLSILEDALQRIRKQIESER